MEIAVLDLGSTTLHLQTFRVGRRLSPELDIKRTTLLGAQVFADGRIDARSWLVHVETFGELLRALRAREISQLCVVATSAVRSAENGPAFVRDLELRFGIKVRVLDAEEEARLSYLGQASAQVSVGRKIAAVDIGGGSVEVAVGRGLKCTRAQSLPIGALRALGDVLAPSGALEAGAAHKLAERIRARLRKDLDWAGAEAPEVTVFGSGSARAARKLLLRDGNTPGKVGPIERDVFRAALDAHLGLCSGRLIELGVEPARAGSVLVVAVLMSELMDQIGAPFAYVTDKGLRDGVALEALAEHPHEQPRGGLGDGALLSMLRSEALLA
jgi:exopolyphosphatase/guanosine-5'-triphosphate,3'-diphosphate pyrophosphatase